MTATIAPSPLDGIRLRFGGVLRSEWIKLRSLRSTLWCYGLIVLLTVAFGVLLAATFSQPDQFTADAQRNVMVQVSTLGVNFTQLIVAVLGVLVISGEYSTGMIRSTFAAVPGRLGAYIAKAVVLAVTTFVVSLISILLAGLAALPILAGKGVDAGLIDWSVILPLIGGAGYLTLIALLAFTFGAIIRNSAGGIASILGLLLVVPTVLQMIGSLTRTIWIQNVAVFLPSAAGGTIFEYQSSGADVPQVDDSGLVHLTTWEGLAVLVVWVVVFGIVGAVLTRRRDA
jgi:ABC-2 type transport system permease protein